MIPKYFKTPDFVEPAAPLYYLVAANGVFLVKKTPLFQSVTQTPALAGLEPQYPSLNLSFGRLPRPLGEQIYGFFDWAWREYESEAIVFLYYQPGSGQFAVDVPPQKVFRYRSGYRWRTELRVRYEAAPAPGGWVWLGDFHSHGDNAPFFSSTDDDDDSRDGLRLVMGDLDGPRPRVRASFVTGGTRFHLDPEEVLEPFDRPQPPPVEWTSRITCEYESEQSSQGAPPDPVHFR